jgi:hypothetical protein
MSDTAAIVAAVCIFSFAFSLGWAAGGGWATRADAHDESHRSGQ